MSDMDILAYNGPEISHKKLFYEILPDRDRFVNLYHTLNSILHIQYYLSGNFLDKHLVKALSLQDIFDNREFRR